MAGTGELSAVPWRLAARPRSRSQAPARAGLPTRRGPHVLRKRRCRRPQRRRPLRGRTKQPCGEFALPLHWSSAMRSGSATGERAAGMEARWMLLLAAIGAWTAAVPYVAKGIGLGVDVAS